MESYHLVHKNDKWLLKKAKSKQLIKSFNTKDRAMEYSTKYMRRNHGSLKVHKLDGKIQEERTYPRSKDPRKSKG